MSVIRLTWACITAGFIAVLLACVGLALGVTRQHLAAELALGSQAAVNAFAQGRTVAEARTAAPAEVAAGRWSQVTVSAGPADKSPLVLTDPQATGNAPRWFAALVRLPVEPAEAALPGGGRIAVLARSDAAYRLLWTLAWSLVLAVALVGAALVAGLSGVLRWARRPLADFQEQIQALSERRFVSLSQPTVSEWIDLSRALNVLVARVGLMLDEKESRLDGMKKQMELDALTGVASRTVMIDRLKQELTEGQRVGAVVIVRAHDLVGMNQRVGRERTDDFLRAVTTALRTRCYPFEDQGAVLARLNGADFSILLPGIEEPALKAWLAAVAEALAALHDVMIAESWHVAWIGASSYKPAESFSDVLTRVDAMVMASETRRERFCLTTPAEPLHLITVAQWRVMIETALDTGHVQLAFFPVKGEGATLLHREAMLRLRGPDGALLPAFAFIPPAIRTGRVLDLDMRAIELAVEELARSAGDVAVNVSPHSIRRPIFLKRLHEVLARAGTDAARLWIEVDELGLSESPDEMQRFGAALKPYGCRLGIDHFGHHFSALPRLGRMGVHYLKLDRAFCVGVQGDAGQQAFVRMVVGVASALGVAIVAEGLTAAGDLDMLEQLGVRGATGPLVSTLSLQETVAI